MLFRFAGHSVADAHDLMAIQFMIMNPGIYGRLIIEIYAMVRDGARCKFRVRLRVPAVHPSIRASIKSFPFLRWMGATPHG